MLLKKLYKTLTTYSLVLFIGLSAGAAVSQEADKDTSFTRQEIVYKQIDNIKLTLTILTPKTIEEGSSNPAILLFFGGGWNSGSITQFEGQAEHFASQGMISVLADYRVKNRHKTTPFDAVRDAKSAMRYLRKNAEKLNIDPNKIAAGGGSAGGHLAAATTLIEGLNEPDEDVSISTKANALVLYNPVIDNGKGGYGFDRIGDRYQEISPLHNISKGAPPTLIMLGTKDRLIPVATGEAYQQKMQAVGSRCDLILYEGAGHGFFNKNRQGGKYWQPTILQAEQFLRSLGYIK